MESIQDNHDRRVFELSLSCTFNFRLLSAIALSKTKFLNFGWLLNWDNASVNSSSVHPPAATAGHLLTLSVLGVGHLQSYRGLGAVHLRTPG